MKIGILTLPLHTNYGGTLQAYALQRILKEMGHEAILINRRFNPPPLKRQVKFLCINAIKSVLTFKRRPLVINIENNVKTKEVYFQNFINEYINPITKPIYSAKELSEDYGNAFDACIVGSDQVWRAIYVPNIEDFFFRFITNPEIKKISYAASFGTIAPEYTKKQILTCKKYINSFHSISVRETEACDVFRHFSWDYSNVKVVLDPTMLLRKEDYVSLLEKQSLSSVPRRIFCYILNNNTNISNIITEVEKITTFTAFHIIDPNNWSHENYTMPSIEYWLSEINNSSFVITDSFHGTVFSILFNKPFIVYLNKQRGAERFLTLLKTFNLEDRIVSDNNNVSLITKKSIDWNKVNLQIEREREKSIHFLATALQVEN